MLKFPKPDHTPNVRLPPIQQQQLQEKGQKKQFSINIPHSRQYQSTEPSGTLHMSNAMQKSGSRTSAVTGKKKSKTRKADADTVPLSSGTLKNIFKLSQKKKQKGNSGRNMEQGMLTNQLTNGDIDVNSLKLKRQLQMVFEADENSFMDAIQNTSKFPMPDSKIPEDYYISQDLERFGGKVGSRKHEQEKELDSILLGSHYEYRDTVNREFFEKHASQHDTVNFPQHGTQSDIIGNLNSKSNSADHEQTQTDHNSLQIQKSNYVDNSSEEKKNLVFPTANPTKRLELYLLSKTIDEMLSRIAQNRPHTSDPDSEHQHMIAHLHATHEIHLIALNEVTRQVYTTCLERGIILHKIHRYFAKFFDTVMEIIANERKRSADLQDLIKEYEKLTNDLAVEKQQQSNEMDRLLKDKTYLFKEREILKRKILTGPKTAPKYDLIIKLLKNTRTRDKLLKSLRRELPEGVRDQVIPDHTNQDEEEDEYFRKFQETDDQDEFFQQFEAKKRAEKEQREKVERELDMVQPQKEHSAQHIQSPLSKRSSHPTPSSTVIPSSPTVLAHPKKQSAISAQEIQTFIQLLCQIVEKIQDLTMVAQYVTKFPIKSIADDRILYSKRVPPTRLLLDSMENIVESLDFILKANNKRQDVMKENEYIHVYLEENKRGTPEELEEYPITVSLFSKAQPKASRTDSDTEELYQVISDLRRTNGHFSEMHKKSQRKIEELEGELKRRSNQSESDTENAEKLRQQYEEEIHNQTMETISMRNKLEKENEDLKELLKIQSETHEKEKKELEEKVAGLENDMNETADPIVYYDETNHHSDVQSPKGTPATSQVSSQKQDSTQDSPAEGGNQSKSERPSSPPLVINININDTKPTEHETIEQISSRPGTPQEKIVYIEKIIEKEKTRLRDLFALLQKEEERRLPSMQGSDIMGPYSDPNENLDQLVPDDPTPSKRQKRFKPIDQHLKDEVGGFTSSISSDRLMELREEMSADDTTVDFGTQVTLLNSRDSKRSKPLTPVTDTASPRSERSIGSSSTTSRPASSQMPLAKNRRLNDVMQRFHNSNTRPKSLLWLLKLISSIYKAKLIADQTENSKMTMPEFLFLYLKKYYGANNIVDEYAGSIMSSIQKYEPDDLRVSIFGKFIREVWSTAVLDEFLKVWIALEKSKYGPDYSKKIGDDGPMLAPVAKIRVDHVLNQQNEDQYDRITRKVREELQNHVTTCTDDIFREAMNRAGHKMTGADAFDVEQNWKVRVEEAKKVVQKAVFFNIFCFVVSDTL